MRVALATLIYVESSVEDVCRAWRCAVLAWCSGAQRLALALPRAWRVTTVALRHGHHCNASCPALRNLAPPRRLVTVIEQRAPTRTVPDHFRWQLLKWALMLRVEEDVVLFSDIDVDLYPTWRYALGSQMIGAEWEERLPRLVSLARGASGFVLVANPDHSSPINGGFWLLVPSARSRRLYEDGLRILRAPFNSTHGWALTGSPYALLHKTLLLHPDGVMR